METIEGNKLIAEFMGVIPERTNDKYWYDGFMLHKAGLPFAYGAMGNGTRELKFHTSWDWLMPVVEKIENNDFEFSIRGNSVTVYNKSGKNPYFQPHSIRVSKIESLWFAVVKFIQWYNENN